MLPVVAIVGRPNVGKSTLFNCLTQSRNALVADTPGLTRDRIYGEGKLGSKPFIVIDTGGIGEADQAIEDLMQHQALLATKEADIILFLVDAKAGLTPSDQFIAQQLRQINKPLFLVVNKTDGMSPEVAVSDFYQLGLGQPQAIAAVHGRGVTALVETTLASYPDTTDEEAKKHSGISIAFVGRPNVGKSTLVNRMLGEERVIVFDMPGTTRDSIFIPFERNEVKYTLIDTAGLRRRGKVTETVEKFSVIKTLQAIEASQVCVVLIDAREGITEQDLHLIGFVIEAGKALVIAVNKWDGMTLEDKEKIRSDVHRRLEFALFAELFFISALHGSCVGDLFPAINRAHEAANQPLSTPFLTKILEDAIKEHQPPLVRGRRIKLRYAHAGGHNPPLIIIHGNQTQSLPDSYKRYLIHTYRKALNLVGTPIRIELKSSENPYQGRRNTLTPRQTRKKRRLMKFQKRK